MVPDSFNICGANLAVRRSALCAGGRLPGRPRPRGGRLISGEEAYLIARLRQQDIFSVYDDRFVVDHSSSAERMAPALAVKRAFWEGFSHVRILQALGAAIPRSLAPIKLILSIPILAASIPGECRLSHSAQHGVWIADGPKGASPSLALRPWVTCEGDQGAGGTEMRATTRRSASFNRLRARLVDRAGGLQAAQGVQMELNRLRIPDLGRSAAGRSTRTGCRTPRPGCRVRPCRPGR